MSTIRWVERRDADNKTIRLAYVRGENPRFRVTSYRCRYAVDERVDGVWALWLGAPRGPYGVRPIRSWYTPEAAMRAVEKAMATSSSAEEPRR